MGWKDPPDKGDWLLGIFVFTVIVCAMIVLMPRI